MPAVCGWYVTVGKTVVALLSADGVIHGSDDALLVSRKTCVELDMGTFQHSSKRIRRVRVLGGKAGAEVPMQCVSKAHRTTTTGTTASSDSESTEYTQPAKRTPERIFPI